MPIKASGFIVEDGRFFESREEAAYEEYKEAVMIQMTRHIEVTEINIVNFLYFIEKNAPLIHDFSTAIIEFTEWKIIQGVEELDDGSSKK